MSNAIRVPVPMTFPRIWELWKIATQAKGEPTAITIIKRIQKHIPQLRHNRATGQLDPKKIQELETNLDADHFIPFKKFERQYLWDKLKTQLLEKPSYFDLEKIDFYAVAFGFSKSTEYIDQMKKWGGRPGDDLEDEDDGEDSDSESTSGS